MELISSFAMSYGRLGRVTWLYRLISIALVCAAFGSLANAAVGSGGAALFAALFLWCAGAVSTQRLHDIGRSGFTLFVLLIPVLGPLWLVTQLLKRGGEGRNQYGADPMARLDYLRVDISK
jgi:uncharacterized membrane protein YhaH (DUF805 family)